MSMQVKHKKTVSFLQITLNCFSFLSSNSETTKSDSVIGEFLPELLEFWFIPAAVKVPGLDEGRGLSVIGPEPVSWALWKFHEIQKKQQKRQAERSEVLLVQMQQPHRWYLIPDQAQHSRFLPYRLVLAALRFHVKHVLTVWLLLTFNCLRSEDVSSSGLVHHQC